MANKMLIDATHPEETRVVVVRGNRVEEFDFESASRRQLRGNIYLAKVTRVEPSLQAAFVEYGGNRHGFLAFSEIHPDYYQIPVADRQALIAEEERAQREADDEVDRRSSRRRERSASRRRDRVRSAPVTGDDNGDAAPAETAADAALDHEAHGDESEAAHHDEYAGASEETGEPVLVVREAIEEQHAAEDASHADHAEGEASTHADDDRSVEPTEVSHDTGEHFEHSEHPELGEHAEHAAAGNEHATHDHAGEAAPANGGY